MRGKLNFATKHERVDELRPHEIEETFQVQLRSCCRGIISNLRKTQTEERVSRFHISETK